MNLLFTYPETIVDGEGIRYSIYLAGCRHHCCGCQNPESWNPSAGTPLTPEKIEKIEVTRKGKVRRAKINYLRTRTGKAAKVKEARTKR